MVDDETIYEHKLIKNHFWLLTVDLIELCLTAELTVLWSYQVVSSKRGETAEKDRIGENEKKTQLK